MGLWDAGVSWLLRWILWMRHGLVWLSVCSGVNMVASLWLGQVGNRVPSPKIACLTCWGLLAPGWSLQPPLPTLASSQCCSSPGPQMSLGHHKVHLLVAVGISLGLHQPPDASHGKAPVSPSPARATSGMTQIRVLMEELLPEHLDGFPVPSSLLLHCHCL